MRTLNEQLLNMARFAEKKVLSGGVIIFTLLNQGCGNKPEIKDPPADLLQLITLDPGHFHAALVQKSMYEAIDSTVHVYALNSMLTWT
jgi:hypothetical protein